MERRGEVTGHQLRHQLRGVEYRPMRRIICIFDIVYSTIELPSKSIIRRPQWSFPPLIFGRFCLGISSPGLVRIDRFRVENR